MKEFTFITTVKIAKNAAELYPNYKINCFTPKSLAKRFASGNSEKNSLKEFAFGLKVELDTSFKPTKLSKIKGA